MPFTGTGITRNTRTKRVTAGIGKALTYKFKAEKAADREPPAAFPEFLELFTGDCHSGHTDACIFTHRGVIACAMVYAGICPIEESFSIEVDYGSKNVLEF